MSWRRKWGCLAGGLIVVACSAYSALEIPDSVASFSSQLAPPFNSNSIARAFDAAAQPSGHAGSLERSRAVYCYAPGTPDDVIKAHAYPAGRSGETPLFNVQSRWPGALGTPVSLTWSFIPDGISVDGENNELFSRMDSLFAEQGGRATWISLVQSCFDRWSSLTGMSYTRITFAGNDWDDGAVFGSAGGSTRGDIRIAMIVNDGFNGVLAYNYYPPNGDMVLDRAENWASIVGNYQLLRNVVMHEHGHGLGLRHVCPVDQTKLMEPFLSFAFEGPQHDDIRAADFLYGDHQELNDSPASAMPLGTLPLGSNLALGQVPAPPVSNGSILSIEADGNQDYFTFNTTSPAYVNVTVAPVGLNYDSSTQKIDGSCNSGNTINSLAIADLGFDVMGANGFTVLASVNISPAGQSETLAGLFLPQPGAYFIRVYESNVPTQPQLYTLAVSNPDCNHNGVSDALDIQNETSIDCNVNVVPDECEIDSSTDTNHNSILDTCERRYGDFDLDGDVDMADFGFLQRCLSNSGVAPCLVADLDANAVIDQGDVAILIGCLSGSDTPYSTNCR